MPYLICPTCHGKVSYKDREELPHRPFCSYRCKMVDLGKWLNEQYRISEPLEHAPDLPKGQIPEGD